MHHLKGHLSHIRCREQDASCNLTQSQGEGKPSLLYCTLHLVRDFQCQNIKFISPKFINNVTVDHWLCYSYHNLLLPPCSISGLHSEAAGCNNYFNMDRCRLTGKIGCDLLRIGSVQWTNYPRGDGNILVQLQAGAAVGVIDVAQWLPERLEACRPQRHFL